jgi:hypothetical protein
MSGIWPWLAALNRLTVLPAFLLQNVWHASRGTFAPSAFVGLQSNNRDGIYFCLLWCFALSINWVRCWSVCCAAGLLARELICSHFKHCGHDASNQPQTYWGALGFKTKPTS